MWLKLTDILDILEQFYNDYIKKINFWSIFASFFLGGTQTHKAVTHPSTDCLDAALLLYSNRANRCFNIGFGIWSALYDQEIQCWYSCDMSSPPAHPNHPQIPTSQYSILDYRTRHESQSCSAMHWINSSRCMISSRHWKYHYFFDIISYHIICQKNDIISFISYR
jgi:hypothetical protein